MLGRRSRNSVPPSAMSMATLFMDTGYLNTGDNGGSKKRKTKAKPRRKKNGAH